MATGTTSNQECHMDGQEDATIAMPFGKYKGRLIRDIPEDYLEWFADNVKAKPFLTEAVAKALGRQGQAQKSKSVPSLTITGSDYVPGNDTTCPFPCE
jgi:putative quorum-sensing-regulated virulence factor